MTTSLRVPAGLVALAAVPPLAVLVHLAVGLPATLVGVPANYDFFLWVAAWWAARWVQRVRPSRRAHVLVVVSIVGTVLSGLYLVPLVGLCGPTGFWFDCRA